MAWTVPSDRTTGDIITAAQWNTWLGTSGDMSLTAAGIVTTQGDTVYATAANTLARLPKGTAYQELGMNSGATAPSWQASPTSVLAVTGDTLYASAANTLAKLAIGSAGQIMTVAGGLPSWATAAASTSTMIDVFADTGSSNAWQLLGWFPTVPFDTSTAFADRAAAGLGGLVYRLGGSGNVYQQMSSNNILFMSQAETGSTSGSIAALRAAPGNGSFDPGLFSWDFTVKISLPNDADRTIFCGFKSSDTGADENNLIGFRVSNNGNIIGVVDKAGVETSRDSGFAGTAAYGGARYVLRCTNQSGVITFYVNGTVVGATITAGSLPATVQYFWLGILNSAAAQRKLFFSDLRIFVKGT